MSDPERKPLGKAIRRSPWERSDLARLDEAAIEAARAFWHEHAPEGQEGLIDAEPTKDPASESHAIRIACAAQTLMTPWMGVGSKAKAAWEYLTKSRAYRAVASGLSLAASSVRSAVERVTGAGEDEARKLGEQIRDGVIDLPAWQTGMESVIHKAHAATGLVGAGGRHAATPKEIEAVRRRITDQFTWLEAFAIEIENGLPLDNKIPDRCSQYATAAVGTYEASRRKGDLSAGWSFERRILHSDVPCKSCTRYAERGWQPALVLPDVGEECECASRCKCTFERSQTDPRQRPVMSTRALEYVLTQPLLCTVEAAELAASIAARDGDPELVATRQGVQVQGAKSLAKRDGVSVLSVTGPISRYASMMEDICPVTSVESLAADLATAVADPSSRAILIDIDSPGGEAKGIAEFAGQIRAANAVKPVCAYVGGEGCSGAYWLAAAAGEVVVSPTAIVGSIGVVSGFKVKSERAGSKTYEFVSTKSPMKRPDPATDAGKASLQKRCDDLCEVFISQVATLRGVTTEKVENDFGRGGVLIGRAAVDAGMADSVGDFESTLARLSREERLGKPKPNEKPGKPAAANFSRGTSMAAKSLNPFKWLSNMYDANPEAVAQAMEEDPSLAAVINNAAVMAKSMGGTLKTEPAADEAAIRAKIEAEYAARARTAETATLAKFFGTQATAYIASQVKAGRLTPADGPIVSALYVELALADHAGPISTGEGKTADRLSLLTSLVDRKPAAAWTAEHVGADGKVVGADGKVREGMTVLNQVRDDGQPKVNADRVLTMLAATPEGRAELARRAAAK